MINACIVFSRVIYRLFNRSFNRNNSWSAFIPFRTLLSFFRRIIGLIRTKTCFCGQIRRANKTSSLFRCSTFTLGRFMINQDNQCMGSLFNRFLGLFRFRETIIRNYQRSRSMFRRIFLPNTISAMRNISLQGKGVAFIGSGRRVVKGRIRRTM